MASISANNKPQTETKKKGLTMKQKDAIAGLIFILPAFISLCVFVLYPLVDSVRISLYEWGILGQKIFIGFENYQRLFSDHIFLQSLWNTFRWVIIYVPASILVSLILA